MTQSETLLREALIEARGALDAIAKSLVVDAPHKICARTARNKIDTALQSIPEPLSTGACAHIRDWLATRHQSNNWPTGVPVDDLEALLRQTETLRQWALDKAATHHRLAHENPHLRTEHIASSSAYRSLADEVAALSIPRLEAHPIPEVQAILLAPAGIEKLRAMRTMCESCNQGFYVEIIDEVLSLCAPRLEAGRVTEEYGNLILSCPGIDDPESDSFMRGFAYGRFSTMDSELARHWGVGRGRPLDECSIVDEPRNILSSTSAHDGEDPNLSEIGE